MRETQQGQDFLESQAAADQLQLHLTQSQQSCEEAVADEMAKDEAYRQASFFEHLVAHAAHLSCKSVGLAAMHNHAAADFREIKPVAAYNLSTY